MTPNDWLPEPISPGEAVRAAQRPDLFEPGPEHEFTPTARKLRLDININAVIAINEPPAVDDEQIMQSIESYIVKCLAAHKFLHFAGIEAVVNSGDY